MKTSTTRTTTPELKVGDVVLCAGVGQVRLVRELHRAPCSKGGHCAEQQGHGEVVSFMAEVVDPAELAERDPWAYSLALGERTHRERNGRWVPENDAVLWVVQGNGLADWYVVD
jgi:hypothetical protein